MKRTATYAMTAFLSHLVLAASPARAGVSVPRVFSDNMVLQRGIQVPIWGWAEAGEEVIVSFAGQEKKATADAGGNWKVSLDSLETNAKTAELTISGKNTLVIKNVLVGEVWICSGQSNMQWRVGGALDPAGEAKTANYPLIRQLAVPNVATDVPQKDFRGSWSVCSPGSVGGFTAVGYFFGRELHKELGIPIGLINSSWGGTRIEPWTPLDGFRLISEAPFAKATIERIEKADPGTESGGKAYAEALAKVKEWLPVAEAAIAKGEYPAPLPPLPSIGRSHQDPTRIQRAMIHPLVPYAIRGAIWYQGESNGGEGITYFQKLQALIGGWRGLWGQGDFPFYIVQLANFTADRKTPEGGDGYAKIREAQRKALEIPNTGVAVIIDIGEAGNIHPRNKQDVGKRLALWALARDYEKDVVCSGPLYKKHAIEGDKIRVHFDHTGTGLMVGLKEGLAPTAEVKDSKLERFAIAGADKKWVWADATIDGETVVVSSPEVKKPVAVRYAYSANPEGRNLYNREGLPASPFRTDKW